MEMFIASILIMACGVGFVYFGRRPQKDQQAHH